MPTTRVIPAEDVARILDAMAEQLRPALERRPIMIGIHTGGVWVADQLHRRLQLDEPVGTLDISFYRDDFTRVGMNPQVKASSLPVDVDRRHIILVDDVLHTGRTIRAAMNEIFDYGRPNSVALAVLVERNGRELPIQADVVGEHMKLGADQHVKLAGPDELKLNVLEVAA
jgi:pyrimidine operon attenuation protein/uracil phosphoribosyltransferase